MLGRLLAERERWPLWLPVFLGSGIAFYFALPVEPPAWSAAALLAGVIAVMVGWRRQGLTLVLVPVAVAALGFGAAQLRTALVAAPVLERPSGKVLVSGRVDEVEPQAEGGQRVTLDQVAAELDGPVPARVRLRLKTAAPVTVGSRVRVWAVMMPPPQPVLPGAFDFARHAWFMGLGAVGTALSAPEVLEPAGGDGWLNRLRHRLGLRVAATVGGAAGGVAAALVTGETSAIPRPVLEQYRDSGLAHLLSISGLHMSLLAGVAFFMVRGGLALVPAVALRHPIKKWAAVAALGATFFYMLLAGAPVPAQRAFLMTGIVLLAVLLDRSALSMRLVAWAAMVVLLIAPEALIGPSFQMSFAAVAALIAVYEVCAAPMAAWRAGHRRPHHRLALYLGGLVLSSVVAGSATALYGAYHFNRFALWSVVANLAAVPLTGVLVMPAAMLALLLMPLGLDGPALAVMGWGVTAINRVAAAVAALPGAALAVPPLPVWGLALFTLGGLWLVLWRGNWRWWGMVALAGGLAGFSVPVRPDLLVDGRAYSFGVRAADGALLVNRGGRILRDTWGRRAGPLAVAEWPKAGRSADGRLWCDRIICSYQSGPVRVALVLREEGVAQACAEAEVVISAVPLRRACAGTKLAIDRFDVWRHGAHAVWLDGLKVETLSAWQGTRPWSYRPVRRRAKPASNAQEAVEP